MIPKFPKDDRVKEISSGIIIFRRTDEGLKFLALYYGRNYWTFPRGRIEREEKSFAAALRETREETGLSRGDIRFVDYFKVYENWIYIKNGQKIYRTIIFYLGETTRSRINISEEHQGFGWFSYYEALKIFSGVKNSENRKVLKKAYAFIQNREKMRALKTDEKRQAQIKTPSQ